MTNNPVSLLGMILLAAFVIDRIVAGLLFLVSFSSAWNKRFPVPVAIESPAVRRDVEKRQKLIYFLLAAVLAFLFLLKFEQVGVLKALGFQSADNISATTTATSVGATAPDPAPTPDPTVGATDVNRRSRGDFLLTWLILVGGAENIARLLKSQGEFGQQQKESQPIEITGKLTLEDRSDRNA